MPTLSFVHTADWHIGKPYHRVEDPDHRARLRMERLAAIDRIGQVVRDTDARFVLVAGDLFDSPNPSDSAVSQVASRMSGLGVPVLVIPGNHDHGGIGGVWARPDVLRQLEKLAPMVRVLLETAPVDVAGAVVLPCPILGRNPTSDPAGWLRTLDWASLPPGPRIVLAHGSVQGFGESGAESDEDAPVGSSRIDLDALPGHEVDYVALGDWHGAKEAAPGAWYSGTPETDRFPRSQEYRSGRVLCVEVARGRTPRVEIRPTGNLGWHVLNHRFNSDEDLQPLTARVDALLDDRAGMDLLLLELDGNLSLEAADRLQSWLRGVEARLLRLKLRDRVAVVPDEDEMRELTQRGGDPLVARVAARLGERIQAPGEEGEVARMALRELYAACARRGG